MPTPFTIDVILADGTNIGTSVNIINLDTQESLDKIGSLSFSLPASDNIVQYLDTGVSFQVTDSTDGYLGTYLFKNKELDDSLGVAVITVNCHSALKELTYETVGFNRFYNNETVNTVIADLITLAAGWSAEIEDDFNTTTIDYQGESIYRAIDEQRDRNKAHFRLKRGYDRILQFGYFGQESDIVFTNLRGQTQLDSQNTNIGIITRINLAYESDEIYNKIIPLGHGQGVTQLTIEDATLGDYTTLSALNDDGSSYYYFEDETSINQHRKRTRILSIPNLRPISNSDADIVNARNALKLAAEAYMSKHLQPQVTYNVDLAYIPSELQVGDKVRLQYKNNVDGISYIDIDEYFYVLDIEKKIDKLMVQ